MRITGSFEGGVVPPFEVVGSTATFDLRGGAMLNAIVLEAPDPMHVALLVDENAVKFLAGQGLVVNGEETRFRSVPLEEHAPGVLRATVTGGGDVRVAGRYPYGRDALDRLIYASQHTPHMRLRLLRRGHRSVPVFDFGDEDGRKTVHFFIAGEDAWETAGSWAADAIVRTLGTDSELAHRLLAGSVVHVVPLVSPHSAGQASGSYTTPEGRGIYGAATWSDAEPPPEYAMIRDEVVAAIQAKRLGFMLTLHSWQAARPHSGVETIRTAGPNSLTDERCDWATRTMRTVFADVPCARIGVAEKIWHPGLARDYLLGEYNTVTFRIEVTTHGQGLEGFEQTGRQILHNLTEVDDWAPVCNP